ncbi:B-cell receptor CD22-like [Megalobrama amblycephala]|uniref:B-cell receptor CD22-like n=1 Tax=Megalobrama amblycephala TaxID=75352 RepID=UPI0020142C6A|nr:B-cell receptor CD22-like [Megalobrama amblycephala]
MVQMWLRLRLYAFPPFTLLLGVLEKICQEGASLILVAPYWPTRIWFSDLVSLLHGSPMELPLRQDLLSQAGGTIIHPRPELWKLWAWPLRGPAISAYHAPLEGDSSVGRDPLVTHFLRGTLRLRPPVRTRTPAWDLAVVLQGLAEAPFEPLEEVPEKFLTLKTAFLLAITSLKKIGDLQALSVAPSYLEFALGMVKAFLHARLGYVPKVPTNVPGVSSADWGVSYSPSHICALKNSSVIMKCTYTYPTGYWIMNVFWTKTMEKYNGEFLDLSKDPEYSQRLQYLGDKRQNCTIRLSHVTLKDSRKYYFRFTTDKPAGRYTGVPGVTLTVTDPPKSVSVSISPSGEIVSGDSVTLICSSDSNPPALNFSWFKGGTFLGSGRIYSISKISSDDSKKYKCKSINELGEKYSDAVTLNVMYPPRSISVSISPSGEIVSGDSVTLICSSDSNPPAEISWFKGGTFVGSGRIYSISKISSDDSGEYKCRSKNQHGEKYSDAVILNVMYPPRSISVSISPSGEIVSGDSVTLICSSDSNPPALNFSWFKEEMFVGSGRIYSISKISSDDSKKYKCISINEHGEKYSEPVTLNIMCELKMVQ